MLVLPSLHELVRALPDLDAAVLLKVYTVVEDLLVSLEHELFEFKLVLLNSSQKVLFPLLSVLIDILKVNIWR